MSDLLFDIFKEVLPGNEEGDVDIATVRSGGGIARKRLEETLSLLPPDSHAPKEVSWLRRCVGSLESGDFGHDFYYLSEEIIEEAGILDFLKFASLVVELFVLAMVEIYGEVDE